MKLMFVIASLLIGSAALAMPAVGDYVKYDAQVTQAGQNYVGTLEQEIIQANGNQYLVKQTQVINGQSQEAQAWQDESKLVSDAQAQQILTYCTQLGGSPDVVTTPAGAVNSCAVPLNDTRSGTAWFGAVPFGIVKADITQNGQHLILIMNTFRRGN